MLRELVFCWTAWMKGKWKGDYYYYYFHYFGVGIVIIFFIFLERWLLLFSYYFGEVIIIIIFFIILEEIGKYWKSAHISERTFKKSLFKFSTANSIRVCVCVFLKYLRGCEMLDSWRLLLLPFLFLPNHFQLPVSTFDPPLLLIHISSYQCRRGFGEVTALHIAVLRGHLPLVSLLTTAGRPL